MDRIGISKPREAHSIGVCWTLSLYPTYISKLRRVQNYGCSSAITASEVVAGKYLFSPHKGLGNVRGAWCVR